MTAIPESVAQRNWKRWLWIGLSVVLLVTAGGVLGTWWFVMKPQSEARAPFVGTWRCVWPPDPNGAALVHDISLRDDGTTHARVWNAATGAIVLDVPGQLWWRVVNGRLQRGHYGNPLLNDIGIGPWSMVFHDGPVTWQGPDCFRYQDDELDGGAEFWVRIDRLGGH